MEKGRFNVVDDIRGLAILLMIIFHIFFDLNNFNYMKIDFFKNPLWWGLPRLIVFLFFLSVGLSLGITHARGIRWKKFWPRLIKISLFAFLISLVTFILFPDKWIYFGTLHCIAFCSLLALPFLRLPTLALSLCLILFLPSIFLHWDLPWPTFNHYSMDYISPFPWFGAVALGIYLFHRDFHKLETPNWPLFRFFRKMGKNSLKIYLIHQPVIFGSLWALSKVF
jgi:uncharacterized membrane protein